MSDFGMSNFVMNDFVISDYATGELVNYESNKKHHEMVNDFCTSNHFTRACRFD